MRYYTITISPSSESKKTFTPITYTTLNANGSDNGSALMIDLDVYQNWYHQPSQNGYLKISGVSFTDLNASANFVNATITIAVGMSAGLPLANPNQKGEVINGTVIQCFGNWQGTEVSLDFIIAGLAFAAPENPSNFYFNWQQGQTLEQAVRNSLNIAYPTLEIFGSYSPNLVYTEDQAGNYQNLSQFSDFVNQISKQINSDPNYLGASIGYNNQGFIISDGTQEAKKTNINYTDIIGNLTWIDVSTIQAKLVMRSDLNVGQYISFPRSSPVINVVNSYSQNRNDISFQGVFMINRIRHVGNNRQSDANSWVTIIDCVIPASLPSGVTPS